MLKYKLSVSLVIYQNDIEQIQKALDSFKNSRIHLSLTIVDNSPSSKIKSLLTHDGTSFLTMPHNPGFGYSHNRAVESVNFQSEYHLIINPDIYFNPDILDEIITFLDKNTNVGAVMPLVKYPNGEIQYLAKLLPSPLDLFLRRILPFGKVKEFFVNKKFELRESKYKVIMEAPYLSGCFLMFRTNVFQLINGFDEKIFLYGEDIDICRRINRAGFKTIFYPHVYVFHDHVYKSFSSLKTLKYYLKSAIYYFNKWGWFFDKERTIINKNTVSQVKRLLL